MFEYKFGSFVTSKSGHDKGTLYVVLDSDEDFVYLCDGRLKPLSNPKKKNKKHVQPIKYCSAELVAKQKEGKLIDEDIKRAIKLYSQDK